jgi:hypothetical protein
MNVRVFWVGVGWALLAATVAWVLLLALTPLFGSIMTLKGCVALLGISYLIFLMRTGQARIGLISTLLGWCVLAGVLLVCQAGLMTWILTQATGIWLFRCATRHGQVGTCLADLLLGAFAIAAAVATLLHSHSAVLSVWVYFLVQALHALIPSRADSNITADATRSRFEQANHEAQQALRRLQRLQ